MWEREIVDCRMRVCRIHCMCRTVCVAFTACVAVRVSHCDVYVALHVLRGVSQCVCRSCVRVCLSQLVCKPMRTRAALTACDDHHEECHPEWHDIDAIKDGCIHRTMQRVTLLDACIRVHPRMLRVLIRVIFRVTFRVQLRLMEASSVGE